MTGRDGFALVISIAVLLALSVAALGVVERGLAESRVAARVEAVARVQAAAESAARQALTRWSTRAATEVPVGETTALEPPDLSAVLEAPWREAVVARVVLERLAPDLFLLRAEAALDRPAASAVTSRAGLLVRVVVPSSIVAGFSDPDPTAPIPPPLDDPDWIDGRASLRVPPGVVRPRPVVRSGACVAAPANWGGVLPSGACHDHLPLIVGRGPIELSGGEGRGILVVRGDVTLAGDARFEGLVVVTGRLTVGDAATIRGGIRAGEWEGRGTVVQDLEAVSAAASASVLDAPFRAAAGWWVPVF